jgi:hypothetical protein
VSTTEVPTRITAQLLLLAVAAQEMGSDEDEMRAIVRRFCFDSMPLVRVQILTSLDSGKETAKEIKKDVRMSTSSIDRQLEDMWYLHMVEKDMDKYVIVDEDLVEMLKVRR